MTAPARHRAACHLVPRAAVPKRTAADVAAAALPRPTPAPRRAQDALLLEGHAKFGNRWTEIAKMVTGRTDNGARGARGALRSPRRLKRCRVLCVVRAAVKNRHAVLVKKQVRVRRTRQAC